MLFEIFSEFNGSLNSFNDESNFSISNKIFSSIS